MDNLNNFYIPVRERIFAQIKKEGISQKVFAQTLGVSPQTITAWKMGENSSFMKKLNPIAEALDVSEVWLLTGKHTAQNPETIREMEQIADAEHVSLLDLVSMGDLERYVTDADAARRTDGTPLTEEDGKRLPQLMTSNAGQLFNGIDYEGKKLFFGIKEVDAFCRNVEHYCSRKGVALETACEESGVGESFLRDLREGKAPSVTMAQAMAKYLGVTTSELLGERTPTPVSGDGLRADAHKLVDGIPPDKLAEAVRYMKFITASADTE